jgi:copper chaperone
MNQHFQVSGMSCQHCANRVQKAVQTLDPKARVEVDLKKGQVDVASERARAELAAAIEQAGYQAQ